MRVEKIKAKTAGAYEVPLYWIYEGEILISMCETKELAKRIIVALEAIESQQKEDL